MAERPGVMFFFDLEPALKMLSDEEAGRLFKAAMEYAHYGVVPEFDGMVALAWTFIQPKIDRDRDAYDLRCKKSEYAAFCSHLGEGVTKPTFEEWEQQTQADAGGCRQTLPTTTGTTTTTPTGTTNTDPTSSSTATGDGKGKAEGVRGGREGETDPLNSSEDANALRNAALEKLDRYGKR